MALKCADLGHLTNSIAVHKMWVGRLEEVRGQCLFIGEKREGKGYILRGAVGSCWVNYKPIHQQ